MIHEIIPLIAGELKEYLESKFDVIDDIVKIGNLMNPDGTMAILEDNKVIITLVNVERDGSNLMGGDSFIKGDLPVHINIYLMFSAYHLDYAEALKLLSGVIGFFQANPTFFHEGNNMKIELQNFDFKELSNIWSILGAKYLPSVVYKIRTIDMDEDNIHDEIPYVEGITIG